MTLIKRTYEVGKNLEECHLTNTGNTSSGATFLADRSGGFSQENRMGPLPGMPQGSLGTQ